LGPGRFSTKTPGQIYAGKKQTWLLIQSTSLEMEHFQAKHVLPKAGMDAGSRQENATKQRNGASDLIRSDRKIL
jgi:hypothetical protein